MVLGMKAKGRNSGNVVQVDYLIHLEEIKPWPPSQSLRSLRSVLIQWENGERNSGSTNQVVPSLGSGSESGRIEFDESFRVSVVLQREMSVRGGESYNFQKNCLEFNLYEPRRDKTVKGQLLGSVILDLADYGMIKESLSVSVPMNCKRSLINTAQPILFLKIQPVEKNRTRLYSNNLIERNAGDSVSALMNEEYAEEAEDDVLSNSSNALSSSTFESNKDSLNGSKAVNGILGDDKDDHFSLASKPTEQHCNHRVISGSSSSTDLSSDFENQANIQSSSSSSIAFEETLNASSEIKGDTKKMIPNSRRSSDPFVKISSAASSSIPSEENLDTSSEIKGDTKKIIPNSRRSSDSFVKKLSPFSYTEDKKVKSESKIENVCSEERRRLANERKVQVLEQRIQMLESELKEAAAIEVSLYSVVAEHCTSVSKVHAPARRISRLYFHYLKENLPSRAARAAKSAVSGLVLAAKACGNDIPRLTFWLSNCIVIRAIITQEFEDRANELKWKDSSRGTATNTGNDWEIPQRITSALEKVESWIFSRIVDSVWWQILTPLMQSNATNKSDDQEQGSFSIEIWKNGLRESFERICPVRAEGHVCGCLSLISKLIMEECASRLDVAMFNAILRASSDEIPTDPVSDPITNPQVLPIPPGKSSFGAGAQLKNAIGNWTRSLSDMLGIDISEPLLEVDDKEDDCSKSFKPFYHLTTLSDLMMLPKDMLLSQSIRKEVCPAFGASLIKRIINTFAPDEFCPDPIPPIVLESLDTVLDDALESSEDSLVRYPCHAAPITYRPPSTNSLSNILRKNQKSGPHLTRSSSLVLRKSYTSDDDLDELDSPLTSIVGTSTDSNSTAKLGSILQSNDVRFQLLREVWINSEL